MSWLSLALQLLTLRRSFHESQSMVEAAKQYAERGKRALAALLVMSVAALFFFSALLVAVIDLGLQIDKGNGVAYSGLMVSATILAGIGLLLLAVAWLTGRSEPPPPPPPPQNPRAEKIKELLEEFAVGFLQNLVKPREKPTGAGPADR